MSPRLKVLLGFMCICLLWGSSWAAVKIAIESIPPLLSLGIRFTIASSILGCIVIAKHLIVPRDKSFWALVLSMCLASFTVPFMLITWAQLHVGSGLASVLFATYPLWVAIISHFLLPNERITPARIIGIVLGFLGIIFIFNHGFSNISSSMVLGMAGIIAGAIIQAFGLVYLRLRGEQSHPITLNFCSMAISTLPLFVASVVFENYSTIRITAAAFGSLVYLSVFCTVVTFVIYFWLVKHVEAVLLSLSAFITPVIAVIIGVLFMGEIITTDIYAGSILVLIGVAFASLGDFFGLHPSPTKQR